MGGGSPSQMLPSPLLWPPPLQSELTRQPSPPSAADFYFPSRLLLYTFIKRIFREGNSVGALHKCPFQKQSCSRCLHLFPFLLVSPFSFCFLSSPFFFFFKTVLPILCIFPRILKETWYGRLLFNLYDVPLSWKGKYTRCIVYSLMGDFFKKKGGRRESIKRN